MDFIELLTLVELGRDRFYSHVRVVNQKEDGELQYLLGRWTYRPVAYQGNWTSIKSPDLLEGLDLESLRKQITHVLLTEYCYYELCAPGENEIRKYNIKKYFGDDICKKSLKEMEDFQNSLVETVGKILKPKLTLIKS